MVETKLTAGSGDELLTLSTPESFLKVIGTQWKKYISETEWTKTREILSRFWDLLDIVGAALGLAATVQLFQRVQTELLLQAFPPVTVVSGVFKFLVQVLPSYVRF